MTRRELAVIIVSLLMAPLAKMIEFAAVPPVGGPDFLVVLAICVGWSSDIWGALPAGFVLGLIEDLVTARALGSRAISLMFGAAVAAGAKSVLNPDSLSSKAAAALVASGLADVVCWGLLTSMGIRLAPGYFARAILLPSALWSALLICPLDAVVGKAAHAIQNLLPSSGRKGRDTAA